MERLHFAEFAAETAAIAGPVPASRIEAIAVVVASHCGVTLADLTGRRRTEHLVRARMLAYHVQREVTRCSTPALAQWWSRDHATILNGCRQTMNRLETVPTFKPFVAQILDAVGASV